MLAELLAAAATAVGALAGGAAADAAPVAPAVAHRLTLEQAVGQRLVGSLPGTTAPPALLRKIRRGELGGVILFGRNVASRAQVRALTRRLQAARRRAPRPLRDRPLLIMVDQEGGLVKRLPGPPRLSAAALGARDDPALARRVGRATARSLRAVGINVNLAPVLDLGLPGGYQRASGRAYAAAPGAVGRIGGAFADGLRDGGVLATAKHFPGLGRGPANQDERLNRFDVSLATLRRADEAPFRDAARRGVPLVMVSTGIYPALDERPAMFSRRVTTDELRRVVGFDGVVVTDDLEVPALAHLSPARKALAAVLAGNDLLLFCQTASAAERGAAAIVATVRRGAIPRAAIDAGADRVLALAATLRSTGAVTSR